MATTKKATVKKSASKPAAKKTTKSAAGRKSGATSFLYLDKEVYKASIDGLMAQGLDREDAVETLKVGIRQANGRPVPPELLGAA